MIRASEETGSSWAERALDASGLVLLVADSTGRILHASSGAAAYFQPEALHNGSLLKLIDNMTSAELRSIASGAAEPAHVFLTQHAIKLPIPGVTPVASITPMGDGLRVVCAANTISATHRALGEIEDIVRGANAEGLWDWEIATGRIWWSPEMAMLLGRENEPTIAHYEERSHTIIHEHDMTRLNAAIQAMLSDEQREYRVEARCRCANGQYRWMLMRAKAIRDAQGNAIRVAGSMMDIHDRREVEQALRESERRARQQTNQLPQFIWEARPDGTIETINERYFELTGVPRDRSINDSSLSLTHPDDQEHALNEWYRSIGSGNDYHVEYRLWMESRREYRWFLIQARASRDSTGQIVRWYGSGTDIHDSKVAELRVRESEERFRLLADSAPVIIWVTDQHGSLQFINRAGVEFIGTRNSSDHETWIGAIHPEDAEWAHQALARTIQSGKGFATEIRVKHDKQDYRWLFSTVAPRLNAAGEVVGVVGVSLDITDRKEEEARIRRLMDELDHRVKNNLTSILYMSNQSLANADSLQDFEQSFTPRLMAMARTHEALARQRWASLPLREVVEMALVPFEPLDSNRLHIEGPEVNICAPKAGPMALVLHELASNAARHGSLRHAAGTLNIVWSVEPDGEVMLAWQEQHNQPADASQGESPTPRCPPGTGLSLVKGMVDFDLRGWVQFSENGQGVSHLIGFNPEKDPPVNPLD